MPALVVKNISAVAHRTLRARAANHGRSVEAEVRAIIEAATHQQPALGIGSELAAIGARYRGVALDTVRTPTSTRAAEFE